MEPLRHVLTSTLEVAHYEDGPADGPPVLLLHGFPYDIHSYVEVAPLLARAGFRVIVPYLRGHGPTRFRDPDRMRSGQQAALGVDVVELLDALEIPRPTSDTRQRRTNTATRSRDDQHRIARPRVRALGDSRSPPNRRTTMSLS
jgi:hypothetical protein